MVKFEGQIIEYIRENAMLHPGNAVVVGVSGGADSVALLRVLVSIRDNCLDYQDLVIKVVHINHMIRGAEADRDENFVRDLCEKLRVDFKVYKKNIPQMASELHLTEEEAGRIYRYQCFEEEASAISETKTEVGSGEHSEEKLDSEKARIAVAHNKDDLAETVLYNLVRGSSLLGLAGIKPVRGRIIRPLLMTSRNEIEEYLKEIGQEFITDSTNLETEYARNKIRLSILPALREINEGASEHLVNIAMDATRLGDDVRKEVETEYKKLNLGEGDSENKKEVSIDIEGMKALSSLAQGELVLNAMEKVCGRRKDITREHLQQTISLGDMESGKSVNLPYGMIAERVYGRIIIRKNSEGLDEDSAVLGHLETESFDYDESISISKKEYTKMIDYDKINSALCLRLPQPEDYIVISAEGGTKKLSRFFTSEKVERSRRGSVPVVADGNEIVWIVGFRLSERYKVTSETRRVMRIDYVAEGIKEN